MIRLTPLARRALRAAALLMALTLSTAAGARAEAASWTGWITDESCGAKGANATHRDCAVKCHQGGALLVFFNSADGAIYKLDDQAKAEDNLGHEVKVTGELADGTLKVAAIERAQG
jgi:hypothetical protein